MECIADGTEAMTALRVHRYDVVVLDWQLPGSTGQDICRAFRQNGGNTPILMLTGMDSVDDKEMGFDNGVDDYLTKPFHLKELSARIRALLKRRELYSATLAAGDIEIHIDSRSVHKRGQQIKLMPKEFALLEFLMRNKGRVFSADELLRCVWSSDSTAGTEALRQCLRRLREKIDDDGKPSLIENVSRRGYMIPEN